MKPAGFPLRLSAARRSSSFEKHKNEVLQPSSALFLYPAGPFGRRHRLERAPCGLQLHAFLLFPLVDRESLLDDEADASEEKGQAARQIHAAPVYDVTQSRAQNVLRFYCETEVKDLSEAAAAKDAHPLPDLLRNAEPSTFGESYRDYFSPSKIADFFGKAATNVLRGEDMKPRLLGFVPVDVSGIAGAPISRSDAERRFVSQSASLIKAGTESLGLEVEGNTRGYRLEGMIEGASELRLTLVSPALGCPAPKKLLPRLTLKQQDR